MARRGTVGDAALAVLAQQGPLELGELARLVAERGATRAKRPEVSVRRAVDWEPQVVELLDGRWASVPAVLDGAVLTHRLAQDEADAKMLPVDPDLAPLAPLAVGGLRLVSGGAAEACDEGHLHGPPSWLGSRKAGDLVALRLQAGSWRSVAWSSRHAWGVDERLGEVVADPLRVQAGTRQEASPVAQDALDFRSTAGPVGDLEVVEAATVKHDVEAGSGERQA